MNVSFDFEQMETLLRYFYRVSGVRYSLLNTLGEVTCFSSELTPFCKMMNQSIEGHARCTQCDANAIDEVKELTSGYLMYQCHAGLVEVILPVRQHGKVLAYIMFGQIAVGENFADHWESVHNAIRWHPDHEAFFELYKQQLFMNNSKIDACAQILDACSSYIWMEGIVRTAFMSDEQILFAFIGEHYAEQLTLASISSALSMSTTKLCGIAAKQGTTITKLINKRRVQEAKRYLKQEALQIADIALLVGISDYNYFTRIFKSITGETPSAYRKRKRPSSDAPAPIAKQPTGFPYLENVL